MSVSKRGIIENKNKQRQLILDIFDTSNIDSEGTFQFNWIADTTGNGRYLVRSNNKLTNNITDIITAIKNKTSFNANIKWIPVSHFNAKALKIYIIDKNDPYVTIDRPIDIENTMLKNLPKGIVIEFSWDGTKFVPIRRRYNKKYPNNMETIRDNLELIDNPINIKTLLGEDIKLMRRYHNEIKRTLFNNTKGDYLLDLGSGPGGDASKWKNYTKIIAVEPNASHIKKLIERVRNDLRTVPILIENRNALSSIDILRGRVFILNTMAQDYEFITDAVNHIFQRKADIVSMMLSLSFFWFDVNKDLVDLIKTINNNLVIGGSFIYLTIDGEKVKNYFDPVIKGPIINSLELLNGDINLNYIRDTSRLEVLFKGTVVQDENARSQLESLVMLNDLRRLFMDIGIIEDYYKDASGIGKFLNNSEIQLTKLYSYGAFIRKTYNNDRKYTSFLLSHSPIAKVLDFDIQNNLAMNEPSVITPCKWYKRPVYRRANVEYEGDSMINLLACFLRTFYSTIGQELPIDLDKRYDLLDQFKTVIKNKGLDLDDDDSFENKIIKLGKMHGFDICILEIQENNLIPFITKYRQPYANNGAIIIGKIGDNYENVSVEKTLIFKPDHPFYISLVIATLIFKMSELNAKKSERIFIDAGDKIDIDLLVQINNISKS